MDFDAPASTWMPSPPRRPVMTLTFSFDLQHLIRSKYHAFAIFISLMPLTPLTTTSLSLASHLRSVSMALFSAGSNFTYYLAPFVLNMTTTSRPFYTSSCGVPRGCRPSAAHHVHYPSQYSHLFPFPWPPSLCRWHSALLLLPPTQLWLKHFSTSKRSSTDIFLDDC